uniref:neuronal membrane glycoprotein M6-b-like n=1 Tax=Styela clava TaxID=7725 RepID=UPI00193A9BAF|nr:neuronal membrane glycoprotein M6-b-like [Styela clava]XP_039264955.1 neuronal membrane glycoprotein M6-b-like [Styela clava]
MSCFESCVKCLGLVPWASLIALVICWAGTALFCGTGHEALTLSLKVLVDAKIPGFSQGTSNIDEVFQAFKYAIYGIAPFMFILTILLLVDGILATRAVKKEIEFSCKTNKCGICAGILYSVITYLTSVAWLLMSVFAGLPIYFFQVSNTQCGIVLDQPSSNITGVCIDFVQAGLMPYQNAPENYGKLCGEDLKTVCDSNDYTLTYQMFLIAFAGSCIVVLSLKHFLMALSANFAYIKMSRKLADYQNTKYQEEMELNDIINTARSNERLTYKY